MSTFIGGDENILFCQILKEGYDPQELKTTVQRLFNILELKINYKLHLDPEQWSQQ